ncbi:polymeric immunoglobulin receptor-like [Astyanax mexicanus]|nr:polymeric immunoglobulin receptor-like [Astyanax mexicanus]
MKIILIFTFYLISAGGGASSEVRGYSGGGVLIRCKYDKEYTSNNKYFCKGSVPNCDDQIKTEVKNKWVNTGRFSLIDNTSSAEFWVMIRELTVQDSGTYQCAVDIYLLKDIYTPVILKMEEDPNYKKSISVNGHLGREVNISCNYPQSLSSKHKFLCRREGIVDCNNNHPLKERRGLIKHDDRTHNFTVSISNVTEGDSGEYWCGAESDWEKDHGYKIYFTRINLTVATDLREPTRTSPSSSSSSMSNTTVDHSKEHKFKSTGASTLETKAFPASSVVTAVSVILVVLLIGLLFITVLLLKKHRKNQAPVYATVDFSKTEDVTSLTINKKEESCDYATIKQ